MVFSPLFCGDFVIILWTQGYYHRGTRLNIMYCRDSFLQPMKQYIITTMLDVVLYCFYFVFAFCLCLCMAIDVSVQYNGGLLPGIILLTQQCYYHRGTHLKAMKRFWICSL